MEIFKAVHRLGADGRAFTADELYRSMTGATVYDGRKRIGIIHALRQMATDGVLAKSGKDSFALVRSHLPEPEPVRLPPPPRVLMPPGPSMLRPLTDAEKKQGRARPARSARL